MSQMPAAIHLLVPTVDTGTTLSQFYNGFLQAMVSTNAGPDAPPYSVNGTLFFDETNTIFRGQFGVGTWRRFIDVTFDDSSGVATYGTIDNAFLNPSRAAQPGIGVAEQAGIVTLLDSESTNDVSYAATASALYRVNQEVGTIKTSLAGYIPTSKVFTADDINVGSGHKFNQALLPYAVPHTTQATAVPGVARYQYNAGTGILDIWTS